MSDKPDRLSEAFARHVIDTPAESIPDSAMDKAKIFILDTVAVGVAGANAPFSSQILEVASLWGAATPDAAPARILGRSVALPAASAAFVNGFQIHCQEYDCVHEPAVVHPMAVLFGALIAESDRLGSGVTGRDLLAATVLGVDVAAGIGVASKAPIRFFRPANAGVFAATLAVARLRGMPIEQAFDALGYALAQCAGTMQAHVEGKPGLPIQVGNAARASIVACDLAEAGVPGARAVFEGPYGYFPLFEGEWESTEVIAQLGEKWRVEEVSHKPFPTGRAAQGGVVAVQRLRERGVTESNLKSLELTAPPLIDRLVGRPFLPEMDVNYARLCFAYIGARVLIDGGIGLFDFSADKLNDQACADVAARISVTSDNTDNPAAFTPQIATAVLLDGTEKLVAIDALYGSPNAPMSEAACMEKVSTCFAFGMQADETRASRLAEYVSALATATCAADLIELATPE